MAASRDVPPGGESSPRATWETASNPSGPEASRLDEGTSTDPGEVRGLQETVLNTSPDLFYVYDLVEKRNIYANKRISDLVGMDPTELLAFGTGVIRHLMHPDDFVVYERDTLPRYATLRDGEAIEHRYRMRHTNGDYRWFHSKEVIFARNADSSVRQIFGILSDVTASVKAERELDEQQRSLAKSEERYRLLFQNMSSAFALHEIVTDAQDRPVDYVFLEANRAFGEMTGLDPKAILGKPVTEVIPGIERDTANWIGRYGRVALTRTSLSFEQYSDSLDKWYAVSAYSPAPRQFVTLFQDVSEIKRLEQQLHQSEKMRAIGQLAGGIAHDFNNHLSGILGLADLISMTTTDSGVKADAEAIVLSATRAAGLTGQLLAFARKGKYLAVNVDLNRLVEEVAGLLAHTLDRRITVYRDLRAQPAIVSGDPSQLQSVIMNLALNARDAMLNWGELTFSTRIRRLDGERFWSDAFEIARGEYLELCVADTGTGMTEAVKSRMFEPFFTTKAPGKGTGMGLAAVYGTVKNHGGAIAVDTKPGAGTRVSVFLPLVRECHAVAHEETPSHPRAAARASRIMVVDDESMVLASTVRGLERLGYSTIAFANGVEALAWFEHSYREVDLVILDLMMPGMHGSVVFEKMKAIHPLVVVLLSSGYSLDGDAQRVLDAGAQAFVQKPVRSAELARVVADALGHR